MTLLNDGDAIYLGTNAASAVYVGAVKAWPPVALTITGTPVLTGSEVEGGTGSSYTGFSVAASGGTPPYSYGLAAGQLPAGITLDPATGVVSGTPAFESAGLYSNIVIRAIDALGAIGKLAPFNLLIAYSDPHYADVKLLLDYDATNNNTNFVDQKFGAVGTMGTLGNIKHVTGQSLYGASSIYFNGSDRLRFADDPHWDLGASPFTIDFTLRPSSLTMGGVVTFLICQFGDNAPVFSWVFFFNNNGGVAMNVSTTGSDNLSAIATADGVLELGVWSRWRLDYDGTDYRLYKNGPMLLKAAGTHTKAAVTVPLSIGGNSGSGVNWPYQGYAQGIRLTVGSARTASDSGYTISNRRFPTG
jgi:hypothetical protein